jgi:hypothetical protein
MLHISVTRQLRPASEAYITQYTLPSSAIKQFEAASSPIQMWFSRRSSHMNALREAALGAFGERLCATIQQDLHRREDGGCIRILPEVSVTRSTAARLVTAMALIGGGRPLVEPGQHDVARRNLLLHQTPEEVARAVRSPYRHDPLHTDGQGFQSRFMDYLCVGCIEKVNCSLGSGDSKVLHLDAWSDFADFASSELGRRSLVHAYWPYGMRPDVGRGRDYLRSLPGVELTERPLFYEHPRYGICMQFLCGHIVPRDEEEKRFLADLQLSIERSSARAVFSLEPGEMYLISNQFWLHGRTPIEPHPELRRHLTSVNCTMD